MYSCSVNMFKNRLDKYLLSLVTHRGMWTLDKPMASMSIVIYDIAWMAILLKKFPMEKH